MPAASSNHSNSTSTMGDLPNGVICRGWLAKSRDPIIRLPLFSRKWVRRYFVLQCNGIPNQFELNQYRDEKMRKLRKTIDLGHCQRVDSYLSYHNDYRWIFAMHFHKNQTHKRPGLYVAAESEQEMNLWVDRLCMALNLEKQDEDDDEDGMGNPVNIDDERSGDEHERYQLDLGTVADLLDSPSDINTPFSDTPRRIPLSDILTENNQDEEENRMCAFHFPPIDRSSRGVPNGRQRDEQRMLQNNKNHRHEYLHISQFNEMAPMDGGGKRGYVHLAECISAQPRPKDCTWSNTSTTTLPLAPLAPIAHRRETSSELSTTSSSGRGDDDQQDTFSSSSSASLTRAPPLDRVPPPPPRPPKTESNFVWDKEIGSVQPLSPLCQRPPAPDPASFDGDQGSSGETIKGHSQESPVIETAPYVNLTLRACPPSVDRSKKPRKSSDEADSTQQQQQQQQHPVVSRMCSFVKKADNNNGNQSPSRPRLPVVLPRTTPRIVKVNNEHIRTPPTPRIVKNNIRTPPTPRIVKVNNEHIAQNNIRTPPTPRTPFDYSPPSGGQLEYLDPRFDRRLPSSSLSQQRMPFSRSTQDDNGGGVSYVVIDDRSTRAVSQAITVTEASRTLERKKKR